MFAGETFVLAVTVTTRQPTTTTLRAVVRDAFTGREGHLTIGRDDNKDDRPSLPSISSSFTVCISGLPPGVARLVLTVTDETRHREDEHVVEFPVLEPWDVSWRLVGPLDTFPLYPEETQPSTSPPSSPSSPSSPSRSSSSWTVPRGCKMTLRGHISVQAAPVVLDRWRVVHTESNTIWAEGTGGGMEHMADDDHDGHGHGDDDEDDGCDDGSVILTPGEMWTVMVPCEISEEMEKEMELTLHLEWRRAGSTTNVVPTTTLATTSSYPDPNSKPTPNASPTMSSLYALPRLRVVDPWLLLRVDRPARATLGTPFPWRVSAHPKAVDPSRWALQVTVHERPGLVVRGLQRQMVPLLPRDFDQENPHPETILEWTVVPCEVGLLPLPDVTFVMVAAASIDADGSRGDGCSVKHTLELPRSLTVWVDRG